MNTHKFIIAIDPDTVKSGVATLEVQTRSLEVRTLSFFELYEYLFELHMSNMADPIVVVIEGGWLNEKSNFHPAAGQGARAHKVAKNVGANHETGKKIVEMCEYLGIEHRIIKPLQKFWAGKDRKITQEEFSAITGYDQRTNQEERDAGLIAWVFADLPVRIQPAKTSSKSYC